MNKKPIDINIRGVSPEVRKLFIQFCNQFGFKQAGAFSYLLKKELGLPLITHETPKKG